jgi:hypothetical protein
MSADAGRPGPGDVLGAVGDAASEVGAFMANLIEEQPAVALLGALTAGFIAGGGLVSPIGTRITASTIRATLGNVATLVALDVVRRAMDQGGQPGGAESSGTE